MPVKATAVARYVRDVSDESKSEKSISDMTREQMRKELHTRFGLVTAKELGLEGVSIFMSFNRPPWSSKKPGTDSTPTPADDSETGSDS